MTYLIQVLHENVWHQRKAITEGSTKSLSKFHIVDWSILKIFDFGLENTHLHKRSREISWRELWHMWLFVMVWYIEQIPEFILTFIYICSFESEPMILFFIKFFKKNSAFLGPVPSLYLIWELWYVRAWCRTGKYLKAGSGTDNLNKSSPFA